MPVQQKSEKPGIFTGFLLAIAMPKKSDLFELGPLFMKRYHDLRKELRSERLSLTTRKSAADLVAQTVGVVAIFGSLVFIASRAFQGNITLGDLVMYFGALQQGQSFLSSLLNGLAGLYEDNLFLTTLYEFLDLKPTVKEPLKSSTST